MLGDFFNVKGLAIAAAAGLVLGNVSGCTVQGWIKDGAVARCEERYAKREADIAKAEADHLKKIADLSSRIGGEAEETAARIEYRTRTIRDLVPIYVPEAAGDRVITGGDRLPYGALSLLDQAAAGGDAAVAVTAGQSYEAGTPVTFTRAVSDVVDNYGICHQNAGQLTALQRWNREAAPPH